MTNRVSITGNATADAELRFTTSGAAVASFTVADTPRYLDRTTNEWKDGPTLFLRVNVWRQQAENVAESLRKGMRVTVTGSLKQRSFETREGERRTIIELDADEVNVSLRHATARVSRNPRNGEPPVPEDPWANAPAAAPSEEEPPPDEPPF